MRQSKFCRRRPKSLISTLQNPIQEGALLVVHGGEVKPQSYLTEVRDQYEAFPFPFRRPEDESQRLVPSEVDRLGKIDHFCFGGKRDFRSPMRILVAGGGTGDALVFLAEQLRECPAEFVYLDLSAASMAMARARMEARGLTGTTWVHGSILDIADLDLGHFDYINCIGVLHHLADPEEGLRCLKSALTAQGAMGLMVYGRHGRRHVYHVQRMMALLCAGDATLAERLQTARTALTDLAATGVVGISPEMAKRLQHSDFDTYLIDTYLHDQDRPYTASEIHGFLASAELHVAGFTNFFGSEGRTTSLDYDPTLFFANGALIQRAARLPEAERQDLAEIMGSAISMHAFYATQAPHIAASITDPTLAPYYPSTLGAGFRESLEGGQRSLEVVFHSGLRRTFGLSGLAAATLAMIDGQRTIHKLVGMATSACPSTDRNQVVQSVLSSIDILVQLGLVLLRDPTLPAIPVHDDPHPWTGTLDFRR